MGSGKTWRRRVAQALVVLALVVGSSLLLSVSTGWWSDVLGVSGIAVVIGGRATPAGAEEPSPSPTPDEAALAPTPSLSSGVDAALCGLAVDPAVPLAGREFTVQVCLRNVGEHNIVDLRASAWVARPGASPVQEAHWQARDLSPGERVVVSATLVLPAGRYLVGARAVPGKATTELDRNPSNNELVREIVVLDGPAASTATPDAPTATPVRHDEPQPSPTATTERATATAKPMDSPEASEHTPTATPNPDATVTSRPGPTDMSTATSTTVPHRAPTNPVPTDTAEPTTPPTSKPTTAPAPTQEAPPPPTATNTSTPVPPAAPTQTPSPVPTVDPTSTPPATPTPTPSVPRPSMPEPEPTATFAPVPTDTPVPTPTETPAPVPTPIDTPTAVPTEEPDSGSGSDTCGPAPDLSDVGVSHVPCECLQGVGHGVGPTRDQIMECLRQHLCRTGSNGSVEGPPGICGH